MRIQSQHSNRPKSTSAQRYVRKAARRVLLASDDLRRAANRTHNADDVRKLLGLAQSTETAAETVHVLASRLASRFPDLG